MTIIPLTGLLAGFVHVLSGPDHLAAVAPLATQEKASSWRTGMRWGIGHSAGVAVVGILSLLLRDLLPLDSISGWSERLVGVLLIGVGVWALRQALRVHAHEHRHESDTHVHIHAHAPGKSHASTAAHVHRHAPLGIGILHGLAGSSHFLGVLPALALPTTFQAAVYLATYGVGTVAAMSVFASLIGRLASSLGTGIAFRRLLAGCSLAAFGMGAVWLVM